MLKAISHTLPLSNGWQADIYREWAFPSEVLDAWRRLACEHGDAGIFLGTIWFESWWDAFGEPERLLVLVLKKNDEVQAIFPCRLSLSSDAEPSRQIYSLTNDHTCIFDFLLDQDTAREACSQFLAAGRQMNFGVGARFEYLPMNSRYVQAFHVAATRDWVPIHSDQGPWAPWLELPGDCNQFVKALPGRLRNMLKRCRKKAGEMGRLEFEVVCESQDLDLRLDELFEIEHQSWKGREGTAMKSDPRVERFYRSLAHRAMSDGSLLLFFLKINNRPIAGSFCLSSGKTVFLLKPGYDDSHRAISPGTLLQAEVLEYLCGRPDIATYNFLGACDGWKMEWRSIPSQVGCMKVYARSVKGWSRYGVEYGWKNMLKRTGIFQIVKRNIDL